MNATFSKIDLIWQKCLSRWNADPLGDIISVLLECNISLRQRDGRLVKITLSKPKLIKDIYIIGLRYQKKDKSFTEDHFECRKERTGPFQEKEIKPYYKRRLELKYDEYKGAHKEQINLQYEKPIGPRKYTDPCTFSLFYNGKNEKS